VLSLRRVVHDDGAHAEVAENDREVFLERQVSSLSNSDNTAKMLCAKQKGAAGLSTADEDAVLERDVLLFLEHMFLVRADAVLVSTGDLAPVRAYRRWTQALPEFC